MTLLLNACRKFAVVFIASRLPQVAVSLHNFPLIFRLFRRSFNGKFVALAEVTCEQIGVVAI